MQRYDKLSTITLLYVEDSRFFAKTILKNIEPYFSRVFLAHNGKEALEILDKHQNEIDIILTDIIMPVMDGLEMIKIIRAKMDIPIVVTTGFEEISTLKQLVELYVDAFMLKPIDTQKLLENIAKIANSIFLKRELDSKKEMIDNDIIYSESDMNGIITYVSKPFEKISGYTSDELIGKRYAILRHHSTPNELYRDMWNTLNSLKQWQGEVTNKNKQGGSYTLNTIISPMYLRGKLLGYSATSIDITELRIKSAKLESSARLDAMGEMISMIAHQWRQPVSSIGMASNNIELDLEMGEFDKDDITQNLYTINQQVSYLSNTIAVFGNFFDKNRQKKPFFITASIINLIQKIQDEYTNHNITINLKDKTKYLKINNFEEDLVLVLTHIITNAREAIIKNGTKNGTINIVLEEDEAFIIIKISNNGGCLKDDVLEKIFTPYFTTKEDKNGAGLGLYISKTIVENTLGGNLSVSNTQDGVEFSILLHHLNI